MRGHIAFAILVGFAYGLVIGGILALALVGW